MGQVKPHALAGQQDVVKALQSKQQRFGSLQDPNCVVLVSYTSKGIDHRHPWRPVHWRVFPSGSP